MSIGVGASRPQSKPIRGLGWRQRPVGLLSSGMHWMWGLAARGLGRTGKPERVGLPQRLPAASPFPQGFPAQRTTTSSGRHRMSGATSVC